MTFLSELKARRFQPGGGVIENASSGPGSWSKSSFEVDIEEVFTIEYHGLRFRFGDVRYSEEENFTGRLPWSIASSAFSDGERTGLSAAVIAPLPGV